MLWLFPHLLQAVEPMVLRAKSFGKTIHHILWALRIVVQNLQHFGILWVVLRLALQALIAWTSSWLHLLETQSIKVNVRWRIDRILHLQEGLLLDASLSSFHGYMSIWRHWELIQDLFLDCCGQGLMRLGLCRIWYLPRVVCVWFWEPCWPSWNSRCTWREIGTRCLVIVKLLMLWKLLHEGLLLLQGQIVLLH